MNESSLSQYLYDSASRLYLGIGGFLLLLPLVSNEVDYPPYLSFMILILSSCCVFATDRYAGYKVLSFDRPLGVGTVFTIISAFVGWVLEIILSVVIWSVLVQIFYNDGDVMWFPFLVVLIIVYPWGIYTIVEKSEFWEYMRLVC